jgi:hypothetical protein
MLENLVGFCGKMGVSWTSIGGGQNSYGHGGSLARKNAAEIHLTAATAA